MDNGIHFISGLPRSGSTLLAAILLQNPRLHAGISSPLASLLMALQRQMSQENEAATFIDDDQRAAILRGVVDGYYARLHPTRLVLDTNRAWCAKLPLLAALFPDARIIACVRDVRWIVDSIERLIRHNALEVSGIFNFESAGTVYARVEALAGGGGLVGYALNAVREAVFGEHADRVMLLTYETLTAEPARALSAVYDFLGEPAFTHDFEDIRFDAEAFDRRLGTPGLHRPLARPVQLHLGEADLDATAPGMIGNAAVGGEQGELGGLAGVFVEGLDGAAPGFMLAVVDLAEVEHRALHDAPASAPFAFDDAPIAVQFAVFGAAVRAQIHGDSSIHTIEAAPRY